MLSFFFLAAVFLAYQEKSGFIIFSQSSDYSYILCGLWRSSLMGLPLASVTAWWFPVIFKK